jgi:hypothetical protein
MYKFKLFPHIEIENFFKNELVEHIKSNFSKLEKINSYQRNIKNEKNLIYKIKVICKKIYCIILLFKWKTKARLNERYA